MSLILSPGSKRLHMLNCSTVLLLHTCLWRAVLLLHTCLWTGQPKRQLPGHSPHPTLHSKASHSVKPHWLVLWAAFNMNQLFSAIDHLQCGPGEHCPCYMQMISGGCKCKTKCKPLNMLLSRLSNRECNMRTQTHCKPLYMLYGTL